MKKDEKLNKDHGNKKNTQKIDSDRIEYYKILEMAKLQQQRPDERIKRTLNINIFRQETRRQQRQFHRQNHQYLKMCGVVVRSSFDENKFTQIGQTTKKINNFVKGNTNNKKVNKRSPIVHVSLDNVQFSCSLIQEKVSMKQLYNLFPFRNESIIFQSHEFLSSQFIFFIFENNNDNLNSLRKKIEATDEGLTTQFKSNINKIFKSVSYFDYLYIINPRTVNAKERQAIYPKNLLDISAQNANYLSKIDNDQKGLFNKEELFVLETQTCQRVIICQQSDIVDNGQTLCFDTVAQYSQFKAQKSIDFKNQKIFQKDAIINTNIRNIISSQKIYLVEIIQQVKSYIQLSIQCQGTAIMEKVYDHLINKADQYLRLLCGYTQSKILTIYNIQNYQEKIYTFIQKSVRYKKQLRKVSQELLKEFPVLEIWFRLPENLLGYTREQLHNTFYQLMQAIIIFEQKMRAASLYNNLKKKRTGIKYL